MIFLLMKKSQYFVFIIFDILIYDNVKFGATCNLLDTDNMVQNDKINLSDNV